MKRQIKICKSLFYQSHWNHKGIIRFRPSMLFIIADSFDNFYLPSLICFILVNHNAVFVFFKGWIPATNRINSIFYDSVELRYPKVDNSLRDRFGVVIMSITQDNIFLWRTGGILDKFYCCNLVLLIRIAYLSYHKKRVQIT